MRQTDYYTGRLQPGTVVGMSGNLRKRYRNVKKAGINVVTMGMFSWSVLEPEEGKYTIEWLQEIVERLYQNGIYTILGTPSGARPKWLAEKYPEVLRVDSQRRRDLFGGRHNHCYTSPAYREKVWEMDKLLGEKSEIIRE